MFAKADIKLEIPPLFSYYEYITGEFCCCEEVWRVVNILAVGKFTFLRFIFTVISAFLNTQKKRSKRNNIRKRVL